MIQYREHVPRRNESEEGVEEGGAEVQYEKRGGVEHAAGDVVRGFALGPVEEGDAADYGEYNAQTVGDAVHYLLKNHISFQINFN
eukprot:CAMPEP_0172497694 /NCGR_PEP_ID=MMETSP1066-20121228/103580_1 /TAXON_ID=671091 /ORGANISM="Coscinodiscus wailesii, Strain CCMP2513" /LENGTH=84 /DNA_ID=CAMNT_0013270607 /DNA_START=469 /DNA_END=720 /DNA_ORIENTATION=-